MTASSSSPSSPAVLVIDDEPTNLALLEFVLTRAGYHVETAMDAPGAVAAMARRRPDLIVMDLQLPGIDGLDLTRNIKADASTRDIVIVAVTACAMVDDEERARAAGCDGYLCKPIDVRAFAGQVQAFLDRRSGHP